jgi:hypothetical protein
VSVTLSHGRMATQSSSAGWNLDEQVLDLTGEGLRNNLAIGASMPGILRLISALGSRLSHPLK